MPTYKIKANGTEYSVEVNETLDGGADVHVDGEKFRVEATGAALRPQPVAAVAAPAAAPPPPSAGPAKPAAPVAAGSGDIAAPIPGIVTQILVKAGDSVAANQVVLKLEAMKMENDIATMVAGTVKEVHINVGSEVSDGQLLVSIG